MSEIKDVVDILDRLNIEIVRITDNEIQCRCPFKENHRHDDKKGSFYVERNTGLCYCFVGCIGGSLVDLVIAINGCSIDEAINYVHSEYVSNKFFEAIKSNQSSPHMDKLPINCDLSPYHFDKMYQYLFDRGFNAETVKDWHLGIDTIDKSIIIPVYFKSQLMGIIKRKLFGQPKYLNTPGMPKSEILFGYDKYTFTDGWVNICEGPLDCIWMHQNGFKNTIATLGASLSNIQFSLLKQIGTGLRICYDNDNAGKIASNKIKGTYGRSIAIEILKLPEQYKDIQEVSNFDNMMLNFNMKELVAT